MPTLFSGGCACGAVRFRLSRIWTLALITCFLSTVALAADSTQAVNCAPEPTDMNISPDTIVNCVIDVSGDADIFRFSAVAGESYFISVTGTTSFGLTSRVYAPDGFTIIHSLFTNNAAYEPISLDQLPQTGTYTFTLESGVAGEVYRFSLTKTSPPQAVVATLSYGVSFTSVLDFAGDTDVLTFDASAGDVIQISGSGQVGWSWFYGPTGAGEYIPLGGPHTVPLDGTYTLMVLADYFVTPGSYTFTPICLSGVCLTRPVPPFSTAAANCQREIGIQVSKVSAAVLKEHRACLANEARGLPCDTGKRDAKIASAISRSDGALQRRCTEANYLELGFTGTEAGIRTILLQQASGSGVELIQQTHPADYSYKP